METKKQNRKKAVEELTRKDILEATITILLSEGIKGLTVDLVAKEAGIAKGTTYLYFKNKDALLSAVTDYAFLELEDEYVFISKSDQSPTTKLKQFVTSTLQYIVTHQALFKELRTVMFTTIDQHAGNPESWYWKTVDLFSMTLDEAIDEGLIRDVNSRKFSALFLDSINSLMMHQVLSTVSEGIQKDVDDIIGLYLNGLAIQ